MYLPGGLRHHKSSSQALAQEPPREVKPLLSLGDGGEGEGLSCVLINTLLARLEKHLPRTLQLNLACLQSITFEQKTDLSENFHGLKLRGFLTSQDTKEMEMNSCLPWWGQKGIPALVDAAPHVRSLLTLSPLEVRNVMEQNKLPLKMLFLEVRKSPGPSLSPKEFSQHWPTTSEQSNSILVPANSAGGWNKKIQLIP